MTSKTTTLKATSPPRTDLHPPRSEGRARAGPWSAGYAELVIGRRDRHSSGTVASTTTRRRV
jgi:hypothetical protein